MRFYVFRKKVTKIKENGYSVQFARKYLGYVSPGTFCGSK